MVVKKFFVFLSKAHDIKSILITFVFFFTIHYSAEQIHFCTLPKSGTFLLDTIFNDLLKCDAIIAHVSGPRGLETLNGSKCVVTIRDPRDFFVSLKNFFANVARHCLMNQTKWPGLDNFSLNDYSQYLKLTEDEKLMHLLNAPNEIINYDVNLHFNLVSQSFTEPNILVIRFEDYIGSKGGGNDDLQRETILKIFDWFGKRIESKKLDYALSNYWENSITFHKGQIGQWKEEFKEEHIQVFKERWNQYLIDWGYETSQDWDTLK